MTGRALVVRTIVRGAFVTLVFLALVFLPETLANLVVGTTP